MICENNRLKYSIDKKNHEIMKVIEAIKASPETSPDQILAMLSSVVDRYEQPIGEDTQGAQNQINTQASASEQNRQRA